MGRRLQAQISSSPWQHAGTVNKGAHAPRFDVGRQVGETTRWSSTGVSDQQREEGGRSTKHAGAVDKAYRRESWARLLCGGETRTGGCLVCSCSPRELPCMQILDGARTAAIDRTTPTLDTDTYRAETHLSGRGSEVGVPRTYVVSVPSVPGSAQQALRPMTWPNTPPPRCCCRVLVSPDVCWVEKWACTAGFPVQIPQSMQALQPGFRGWLHGESRALPDAATLAYKLVNLGRGRRIITPSFPSRCPVPVTAAASPGDAAACAIGIPTVAWRWMQLLQLALAWVWQSTTPTPRAPRPACPACQCSECECSAMQLA